MSFQSVQKYSLRAFIVIALLSLAAAFFLLDNKASAAASVTSGNCAMNPGTQSYSGSNFKFKMRVLIPGNGSGPEGAVETPFEKNLGPHHMRAIGNGKTINSTFPAAQDYVLLDDAIAAPKTVSYTIYLFVGNFDTPVYKTSRVCTINVTAPDSGGGGANQPVARPPTNTAGGGGAAGGGSASTDEGCQPKDGNWTDNYVDKMIDSYSSQFLAATGVADFSTLILREIFAGREQWVRNLEGRGGNSLPLSLRNVSFALDRNTARLMVGEAANFVDCNKAAQLKTIWRERAQFVPGWAAGLFSGSWQTLIDGKISFGIELLAAPGINMSGEPPLFAVGQAPISLFSFGVLQDGERCFLRSVGAKDLMSVLWPIYAAIYHRPAGSPIPAGYEAGLTFGSPVWQGGNSYLRSPVMSTELYRSWAAAGYPCEDEDLQFEGYTPISDDSTGGQSTDSGTGGASDQSAGGGAGGEGSVAERRAAAARSIYRDSTWSVPDNQAARPAAGGSGFAPLERFAAGANLTAESTWATSRLQGSSPTDAASVAIKDIAAANNRPEVRQAYINAVLVQYGSKPIRSTGTL